MKEHKNMRKSKNSLTTDNIQTGEDNKTHSEQKTILKEERVKNWFANTLFSASNSNKCIL